MITDQNLDPTLCRKVAAEEFSIRRKARRSMSDWVRACGYEPAKHHQFLIDKLEAVVRGEIKRLAIFMPPGSAKSTYSSVLFPPWFLAQKPDSAILTASHSADLATTFGRRSRNLIDENQSVLGYSLRTDTRAADEWQTNKGGVFFCAGVRGRIAGRRADLALIDDPVGSKDDAYSKAIRDSTWDWYNYDFRTRLKPEAPVILIQTRWHEDDLAGRLIENEGDEWDIIKIPMIAGENDPIGRQPGEMLWSEYFSDRMLADAKKVPSVFSALWQQNPTPEDGDYFEKSWIEDNAYERNELPTEEMAYYCASDHAVSQREEADSTCMIPFGVDPAGVIWVLPDIVWGKYNSLQAVQKMIELMKRRNLRAWIAESEKITKSIGPFLRRHMLEEGVFCYINEITPAKDKQTRAQSIRGRLQAGMVRFPKSAKWYCDALDQMLKFPGGAHDDFVDALAYIGLGLDRMSLGAKARPKTDPNAYLKPTRITMDWLKKQDRRQKRRISFALADN